MCYFSFAFFYLTYNIVKLSFDYIIDKFSAMSGFTVSILPSFLVDLCSPQCVHALTHSFLPSPPPSVPAFKNEWYWKRLMSGDPDYVEFHNKNYGCSGVMPDKFPCTGPKFS